MQFRALSQIVPSPEEFAANPPSRPQVWSMPSEPLRHLLDLAGFDRILERGLPLEAFHAVRGGIGVPQSEYTWGSRPIERSFSDNVRPAPVHRLLGEGSTVVLNALHRFWEPVGDFCRRLGYEVGLPASARGFLTPANQPGFPYHHDESGNLLIQTVGSKVWRVRPPRIPDPLPHETSGGNVPNEVELGELTTQPPELETTLQPGDVLWIPRGWLHSGTATDEASVHVAVEFVPLITKYWLAGKLAERLDEARPEFAWLRQELPWGVTRRPDELAEAIAQTLKDLIVTLPLMDVGAAAAALVCDVRQYFREPAGTPTLSATADLTDQETRVVLVAETLSGVERLDDENLRLHIGDTALTFTGSMADFLEDELARDARTEWCARDITRLPDTNSAVDSVKQLLRMGIVRHAES